MSAKPSILIVEPVRQGRTHQAFNASLIATCHAAFPHHQIVVAACEDHLEALREALGEPSWLLMQPLPAVSLSSVADIRSDVRVSMTVTRLVRQWHVEHLILSSFRTRLLWTLRLMGAFLARPLNIVAIFHAGLASLVRRRRFGRLFTLFSERGALLALRSSVRFVVLEQAVLNELHKRDPVLAARCEVFPHPIPPECLRSASGARMPRGLPVRVGLLGLATPQKGLLNFLALAREARDSYPGEFDFELVGRLHQDYQHLAGEVEEVSGRSVPQGVLSREEFLTRLARLDYALFLFEGGYYQFTPSGVLVDCIAMNLPVISTSSALIDNLESDLGPIGLRLEQVKPRLQLQQLRKEVREVNYGALQRNLCHLCKARTPQALSGTLHAILTGDKASVRKARVLWSRLHND